MTSSGTFSEAFDFVICATGRFDPTRVVIPHWAQRIGSGVPKCVSAMQLDPKTCRNRNVVIGIRREVDSHVMTNDDVICSWRRSVCDRSDPSLCIRRCQTCHHSDATIALGLPSLLVRIARTHSALLEAVLGCGPAQKSGSARKDRSCETLSTRWSSSHASSARL